MKTMVFSSTLFVIGAGGTFYLGAENGASAAIVGMVFSYIGTMAFKDFLAWRVHRRLHPGEPFYPPTVSDSEHPGNK